MTEHYHGSYWVRGDDNERYTDEPAAMGWTDQDAQWNAYENGREWYWSTTQSRWLSARDGRTTIADVAKRIADTGDGGVLAADFWTMAAQHAARATGARLDAAVSAQIASVQLASPMAENLAAIAEAGDAHEKSLAMVTEIEDLGHDAYVAEYGDGFGADFVNDFGGDVVGDAVPDYVHVARIRAEDSERAEHAETYHHQIQARSADLAATGRTATELAGIAQAKRADDDALDEEYHAEKNRRIRDERAAERANPFNSAWRDAVTITYREYVIDYGNDGRPEDDRHLPAEDAARRAAAIDLIAAETGVPTSFIQGLMNNAAYDYNTTPGTDNDPDYFAPPSPEGLTENWLTSPQWLYEAADAHDRAVSAETDPDHFAPPDWADLTEESLDTPRQQQAADEREPFIGGTHNRPWAGPAELTTLTSEPTTATPSERESVADDECATYPALSSDPRVRAEAGALDGEDVDCTLSAAHDDGGQHLTSSGLAWVDPGYTGSGLGEFPSEPDEALGQTTADTWDIHHVGTEDAMLRLETESEFTARTGHSPERAWHQWHAQRKAAMEESAASPPGRGLAEDSSDHFALPPWEHLDAGMSADEVLAALITDLDITAKISELTDELDQARMAAEADHDPGFDPDTLWFRVEELEGWIARLTSQLDTTDESPAPTTAAVPGSTAEPAESATNASATAEQAPNTAVTQRTAVDDFARETNPKAPEDPTAASAGLDDISPPLPGDAKHGAADSGRGSEVTADAPGPSTTLSLSEYTEGHRERWAFAARLETQLDQVGARLTDPSLSTEDRLWLSAYAESLERTLWRASDPDRTADDIPVPAGVARETMTIEAIRAAQDHQAAFTAAGFADRAMERERHRAAAEAQDRANRAAWAQRCLDALAAAADNENQHTAETDAGDVARGTDLDAGGHRDRADLTAQETLGQQGESGNPDSGGGQAPGACVGDPGGPEGGEPPGKSRAAEAVAAAHNAVRTHTERVADNHASAQQASHPPAVAEQGLGDQDLPAAGFEADAPGEGDG